MIAFIVGKKLSGKTYYTQRFLERSRKPFIVVDSLVEYKVDSRFDNVQDFIEAMQNRNDKIKLGNIGLSLPTTDEALEFFAWSWHLNPHILVIEEFHQYGNAWGMPTQLDRLFRMGRHRGIDIVGITQRFSDLPQVARTQTDAIIFFQQQGDRDFVAIEKFATAELAQRVLKLKPRQHIEYRF